MARSRYRQALASLAALAMLGVAAPAPLWAQGEAGADSSPLTSLRGVKLGQRSGVSCYNLGGYTTYLVADGSSTRPAVVILVHPKPTQVAPGALQTLGERFLRSYCLHGYRICPARDQSAVFLFREEGQERPSFTEEDIKNILNQSGNILAAIDWLNSCCGGSPHRVEGSKVIWRTLLATGRSRRECDFALNLLHGTPCFVEVLLHNPNIAAVADALCGRLGVELKAPARSKGNLLRKRLGVKPLACLASKHLEETISLVRVSGEDSLYRLGSVHALNRISSAPIHLPPLPPQRRADEAANTPPSRAPHTPAARPSSSENKAVKPLPQLTPAEAREAYSKLLREI